MRSKYLGKRTRSIIQQIKNVTRAVANLNGTIICQFRSSFQLKGFQSQLFILLKSNGDKMARRSKSQEGLSSTAPGMIPRQNGLRGCEGLSGHRGLVAKWPLGGKAEIKGCRRAEALLRRK